MTCGCNKTKEISTSNSVDNPPLKIEGLDLTEKIDTLYLNTDSTKFPNDELTAVNGEPYPHEPHLDEFVPCDTYCPVQEIWLPRTQETYDDSKHPRAPKGAAGSKGGRFIKKGESASVGDSDRKNDFDQEIDAEIDSYQKRMRTFIDYNTKPEIKNKIISETKRDYELVHGEGVWIGRDQELSNKNWIDYHNQKVTDHAAWRAIDTEIKEREFNEEEWNNKSAANREALDDMEYQYDRNFRKLVGDAIFLRGSEPENIKNYIKDNTPYTADKANGNDHFYTDVPEEEWDKAIKLVKERNKLTGTKGQISGDENELRRLKFEQKELEWQQKNLVVSSIPRASFYVEKDSLHSHIVHQITSQVRAAAPHMNDGSGVTPKLKIKIHAGRSEATFKVGRTLYRRGASWNKNDETVNVFNASDDRHKSVQGTMAHELAHGQYDNMIINDKTKTAMGTFHEEAAKLSRSVKKSEDITDYFSKYAKQRRSDKKQGKYQRGYGNNMETELFAALAEHQMDRRIGGKPFDGEGFIPKYDRLKRDYPKLLKSFETLRGMEGTHFGE